MSDHSFNSQKGRRTCCPIDKQRFSLVELLVMISILAVLSSLLSPSLARLVERGRDISCRSNMSSLFTAITLYSEDHNHFYPAAGSSEDPLSTNPNHLDYNLANPHLDVTWDDRLSGYDGRPPLSAAQMSHHFLHSEGQQQSGANKDAWMEPNSNSSIYLCPNDPFDHNVAWFDHPLLGRSYAINGFNSNGEIVGVTNNNRSIASGEVEDASGTILLAPYPTQNGILGRANNHTMLSPSRTHYPSSTKGLWQNFQMMGLHNEMNNYLFIDGHIDQLHYKWTTAQGKEDNFGRSAGGMWTTASGD